jgi:hypothetical protein
MDWKWRGEDGPAQVRRRHGVPGASVGEESGPEEQLTMNYGAATHPHQFGQRLRLWLRDRERNPIPSTELCDLAVACVVEVHGIALMP